MLNVDLFFLQNLFKLLSTNKNTLVTVLKFPHFCLDIRHILQPSRQSYHVHPSSGEIDYLNPLFVDSLDLLKSSLWNFKQMKIIHHCKQYTTNYRTCFLWIYSLTNILCLISTYTVQPALINNNNYIKLIYYVPIFFFL